MLSNKAWEEKHLKETQEKKHCLIKPNCRARKKWEEEYYYLIKPGFIMEKEYYLMRLRYNLKKECCLIRSYHCLEKHCPIKSDNKPELEYFSIK